LDNHYSRFILTDHAMKRMRLRGITADMVQHAIVKPDERKVEADGDIKFIRTLDHRQLHVVARYLDDEKKWLVKSTWVRGEDDPVPLLKRLLMIPVNFLRRMLSGRN
jgi:hypothetical protein